MAPSAQQAPLLNELAQVLRPAHLYSFAPRVMALPAALDTEHKFCMEADGFGLATLLLDIVAGYPERFIKLREHFCALYPQFSEVRVERERGLKRLNQVEGLSNENIDAGYGIQLVAQGSRVIRARQASDGAILILGFLALAYLPEAPGLLLIEEPENGIYPKRLEEVIRMLRQMFQGQEGSGAEESEPGKFPQIVFTTHSPFVVSFFEPKELTLLWRDPRQPEAGVRARPLRDVPDLRERLAGGEFYLGELWYNLSEEDAFGEFAAPDSH